MPVVDEEAPGYSASGALSSSASVEILAKTVLFWNDSLDTSVYYNMQERTMTLSKIVYTLAGGPPEFEAPRLQPAKHMGKSRAAL